MTIRDRYGKLMHDPVTRDAVVDLAEVLDRVAEKHARNKAAKGDDHDESRRRVAMIEIDPDAVPPPSKKP